METQTIMPMKAGVGMLGPKILLQGPAGTGKTHSIGTLVDWASKNGKEVFVLFVENGLESLLGYWTDKGQEVPSNLYWHSTTTRPLSLKQLIDAADKVGKLSYKAITEMVDPNRGGENNAFWKILSSCNDFTDFRSGRKFGSVETWGTDRIFVIDSLSSLSNAALKMVTGVKPTAAPSDYLQAQGLLYPFIDNLAQTVGASFVMTAHVTREVDEITGGIKLMTSTIGKALIGKIPCLFSDVIYTVREGTNFYWDTAASNVDLKTRNLPIASKIKPDFAQIMEKWKSRGGV